MEDDKAVAGEIVSAKYSEDKQWYNCQEVAIPSTHLSHWNLTSGSEYIYYTFDGYLQDSATAPESTIPLERSTFIA